MGQYQVKISKNDTVKGKDSVEAESNFALKTNNNQKKLPPIDASTLPNWAAIQSRMNLPNLLTNLQFSTNLPLTADARSLHRTAALGLSGPSRALPYLHRIQKSFGIHNITNTRAYVGASAMLANRAVGAEAYTTGNKIAFAKNPSLRTAAHEAAHVIQQRYGIHLRNGIGNNNDIHEKNADAVADLVTQGKSVETLLNPYLALSSVEQSNVGAQVQFSKKGKEAEKELEEIRSDREEEGNEGDFTEKEWEELEQELEENDEEDLTKEEEQVLILELVKEGYGEIFTEEELKAAEFVEDNGKEFPTDKVAENEKLALKNDENDQYTHVIHNANQDRLSNLPEEIRQHLFTFLDPLSYVNQSLSSKSSYQFAFDETNLHYYIKNSIIEKLSNGSITENQFFNLISKLYAKFNNFRVNIVTYTLFEMLRRVKDNSLDQKVFLALLKKFHNSPFITFYFTDQLLTDIRQIFDPASLIVSDNEEWLELFLAGTKIEDENAISDFSFDIEELSPSAIEEIFAQFETEKSVNSGKRKRETEELHSAPSFLDFDEFPLDAIDEIYVLIENKIKKSRYETELTEQSIAGTGYFADLPAELTQYIIQLIPYRDLLQLFWTNKNYAKLIVDTIKDYTIPQLEDYTVFGILNILARHVPNSALREEQKFKLSAAVQAEDVNLVENIIKALGWRRYTSPVSSSFAHNDLSLNYFNQQVINHVLLTARLRNVSQSIKYPQKKVYHTSNRDFDPYLEELVLHWRNIYALIGEEEKYTQEDLLAKIIADREILSGSGQNLTITTDEAGKRILFLNQIIDIRKLGSIKTKYGLESKYCIEDCKKNRWKLIEEIEQYLHQHPFHSELQRLLYADPWTLHYSGNNYLACTQCLATYFAVGVNKFRGSHAHKSPSIIPPLVKENSVYLTYFLGESLFKQLVENQENFEQLYKFLALIEGLDQASQVSKDFIKLYDGVKILDISLPGVNRIFDFPCPGCKKAIPVNLRFGNTPANIICKDSSCGWKLF